jgi:hypothetical protein
MPQFKLLGPWRGFTLIEFPRVSQMAWLFRQGVWAISPENSAFLTTSCRNDRDVHLGKIGQESKPWPQKASI